MRHGKKWRKKLIKKETLKQWIKFASVGALGVGVNALFFTLFSMTLFGKIAPLTYFGFGKELTIAWGLGILFAMTSNFFLSKFWVFRNE